MRFRFSRQAKIDIEEIRRVVHGARDLTGDDPLE
jgi:hypothetical protein